MHPVVDRGIFCRIDSQRGSVKRGCQFMNALHASKLARHLDQNYSASDLLNVTSGIVHFFGYCRTSEVRTFRLVEARGAATVQFPQFDARVLERVIRPIIEVPVASASRPIGP